jgi:hypothetical protein
MIFSSSHSLSAVNAILTNNPDSFLCKVKAQASHLRSEYSCSEHGETPEVKITENLVEFECVVLFFEPITEIRTLFATFHF